MSTGQSPPSPSPVWCVCVCVCVCTRAGEGDGTRAKSRAQALLFRSHGPVVDIRRTCVYLAPAAPPARPPVYIIDYRALFTCFSTDSLFLIINDRRQCVVSPATTAWGFLPCVSLSLSLLLCVFQWEYLPKKQKRKTINKWIWNDESLHLTEDRRIPFQQESVGRGVDTHMRWLFLGPFSSSYSFFPPCCSICAGGGSWLSPVGTVSWLATSRLLSVIEKTTSSTLNRKVYISGGLRSREIVRERFDTTEKEQTWDRLIQKAAAIPKPSSWLPRHHPALRLWTRRPTRPATRWPPPPARRPSPSRTLTAGCTSAPTTGPLPPLRPLLPLRPRLPPLRSARLLKRPTFLRARPAATLPSTWTTGITISS